MISSYETEKRFLGVVDRPSWFGESFHYWPQDALALARAMALVEVVSANSEQAGAIYQEILDTWVKPETKQLYDELIAEVPDSEKEGWTWLRQTLFLTN